MKLSASVAVLVVAPWIPTTASLAASTGEHVQVSSTQAAVKDFLLTDQDGRPFQLSSLQGQGALIFFGFTHCPSICPATMFKLRELLRLQVQRRGIIPRVVMISVDGERDTPAALKSYLEPLSPDFIGLTGSPKVVRGIAQEFSAVFFKGLPSDDSGNYAVDHTSQVYLLDGEGRLRATFSDATVAEMSESLKRILGPAARES